jgi:O-antigen ligase
MGMATTLLYPDLDSESYMSLQGALHWPITIIQLGLFFIAAFLISTRWRRVAAAALKAWPLLVLVAIQVMSIAWSINPTITARKAVYELMMLSIGIYLGERYTPDEFATLLAKILCQAMGLIIILYFMARHFVLDAGQGNALKGLAQTKNLFGFYIGLTTVLLLVVRFRRYDWIRYLCLPVAFGMLLFSRSMTSVASAAVIIVSLPLLLIVRLPAKQRAAGCIFVALAVGTLGCLAVLFSNDVLALLGKNATLSGRTEVWNQLSVAIQQHPVLGYGYGAFWTGLRGESLDVLIAAGWIVPSAHNAYLELCLALGIPGVAATIIVIFSVFRKAIMYIRSVPGWPGLWPIACILFVLVHGFGESEFIFDASFACCLFTALYTSLAVRRVGLMRKAVLIPTQRAAA